MTLFQIIAIITAIVIAIIAIVFFINALRGTSVRTMTHKQRIKLRKAMHDKYSKK